MFHHLLLSVFFSIGIFTFSVNAQVLKPGFDPEEYKQLMYVSARAGVGEEYSAKFPEPTNFKLVYNSPVVGLENFWNLWVDNRSVAVLNIRGTTADATSWLANFYAAMVPASGQLKLSENETFEYHLAENPRAAVHIGWLLSTAYLSKDMLPRIDSLYKTGVKEFLIMGHSQGGAIAFLMTSHLLSLQKQGKLPKDLQFKTYCSAGPKPGNLYYAYEYEVQTQAGWAYNVVNSADWVPETPVSIQTVDDFNTTNPFIGAKAAIKKQKFPKNVALKSVYNKLDKPTRKAQKNYEKYLGKMVSKMINANLTDYIPPTYYSSNHYVRTGFTIVLLADAEYYIKFPDNKENVFIHHVHEPYLYLLEKQF